MKRIPLFLLVLLIFPAIVSAQHKASNESYTFLLTGASFASPNNGWFEVGCDILGAKPVNRAIGGEAIADAANRMVKGTLYTKAELEEIDALVIMQVHDKDVFDESQLSDKYTDYQTPFDRSNYAAAYDYVIKRYMAECYNLKFDEGSKYYNTKYGKPAVVVLCTDWHDARVTFNTSVRKLAAKWGFPVVEFDQFIGFSKNTVHPVTGEQVSLLFTGDKQTIDGVTYGWHPENGTDAYIQRRMGAIFADTMQKIFPIKHEVFAKPHFAK
ncbi:MAG TPA: DUF5040 domain-containing protein [Porphyromonadaceae bacterium]|mgnify:FL=1|jgi:hypothetical protein|nr:DUF5040 domain-containing protein [Porphyromonadaceae bacterium]HBL34970.1 DUF5040 domain-containing protein [Porphyromonadaceae bacterium]HBX21212.1 DUF5040 domain-containing protein [Porphyromonadaceae bacterium]HCM20590.1 DUF5040 domain-containing protein [Porphyromonadaceae bacterium]